MFCRRFFFAGIDLLCSLCTYSIFDASQANSTRCSSFSRAKEGSLCPQRPFNSPQRPSAFSLNGQIAFLRWPIRLVLALGQGLSRGPLGPTRSSDRARVWHHNVGRLPYERVLGGIKWGRDGVPPRWNERFSGRSSLLAAQSL